MKRWLKRIALVLSLPLLAILAAIAWAGYQLVASGTKDNTVHMRSKVAYLAKLAALPARREGQHRPNILIVYYDDLGYGDLGFTGSKAIHTPNIDALAAESVVLSNYHSPSPVCSPSRAGMLTGRLPPRAGMPNVIHPTEGSVRGKLFAGGGPTRLGAEEITIADVLKAAGYRTGMVGKWHLGDQAPSLPNLFGFDHFYGALYSNDMEPFALWRNSKVEVAAPADQTKLDGLYTAEVVKFIGGAGKSDKPFFLYFAHNFPHVPLYVAKANRGRSDAGLYGDVVEALDDGIGRIVAELKSTDRYENTILILTSDNGPWFEGSPGAYRGRKGQTFEGGMHVPFLIHWSKGFEGGKTVSNMAMGTDIMPTLLDWLGLPLPDDRIIDGQSMRGIIEGNGGDAVHLTYFYSSNDLLAVSDGRFKYHPRQPYMYVLGGSNFAAPFQQGPWLFDLSNDPDESYDVSMKHPEAAARLKAALDARNAEMAENLRGWR